MLDSEAQETLQRGPRAGVPSIWMPRSTRKTLLEPGHEAEWQRLNDEKRAALTPPPDTPVGELLRRGQHLSAQAAKLSRAVERGNGGSRS